MNQAARPDAGLPPYEGVSLADILLVQSNDDAAEALEVLMAADVLGFDTESKPTFMKGELSTGPHLVQLATDHKVYLFPVGATTRVQELKAILESKRTMKVGFGLSDDLKRLQFKLSIFSAHVLDLSIALRDGQRNDVGAKTAVARFFAMRLQKSKKTSTTNWAHPDLTERQILYAADDAHVALRVYRTWSRGA
jgi:ribonuclease D